MSDTTGSNAPPVPVFPPGRYGRRRAPGSPYRRWWGVVGAAAVAAAGLWVGVRGYQEFGDPAYQPQVITYTDVSDTAITIVFRVDLPAGAGATCALRARARDGAVVGAAEVAVPAGQPVQRRVLPTTRRAFIGEVPRCRAG
ncbi:MAG TPA: DUF4307 domain-containing protein [Pilimelia sp.]|nr:DUF4307 domain-containing protein [Pilimelia sp.]